MVKPNLLGVVRRAACVIYEAALGNALDVLSHCRGKAMGKLQNKERFISMPHLRERILTDE